MRLTFALAALGIAAFALAAVSFGTGAQAKTVEIEAGNLYFCDASKEGQVCETAGVVAGDTVTWRVASGSHQVVQCTDATFASCTGGFDLGSFSTGQTKSQTFNAAGDVFYRCAFHPSDMKGKIVVAAAATPTPTRAPTADPSQTAAASTTVTPAAIPATGGPPDDGSGGSSAWEYVLLGAGSVFMMGAAAAFVIARRR